MHQLKLTSEQIIRNIKLSILNDEDDWIFKSIYTSMEGTFRKLEKYTNNNNGNVAYGLSKQDVLFHYSKRLRELSVCDKILRGSEVINNNLISNLEVRREVFGWYLKEQFNFDMRDVYAYDLNIYAWWLD